MKNLTIFVDMDGTIEHLLTAWLKYLNKKYNRNVKPEDVTAWDISLAYPGVPIEEIMAVLDEDEIWDEVEPVDGAPETLEYFKKCGHKVYIATATPYESIPAKMDNLLFKYFPFITWDDVIIIKNKQLLQGDVMIDDGVHNLIGGSYKKILIDAPYNREANDEANDLIRVKNWDEIRTIIDQMAGLRAV